MYLVLALSILIGAAPALASGWNDYRLEIAPGFSVEQMNSFMVCLGGGPDDLLLVCPDRSSTFGPLVEYAVTEDAIITRHLGSKPPMLQIDPDKEFYFLVRRLDQHVTGPLTRSAWEQSGLPRLSSLPWVEPHNPNFWTPLLGKLLFLSFMGGVYIGPLLLLGLIALWLLRTRARRKRAAA